MSVTTDQTRVRNTLSNRKARTVAELARLTRLTEEQVESALARLDGRGYWRREMTPDGWAYTRALQGRRRR